MAYHALDNRFRAQHLAFVFRKLNGINVEQLRSFVSGVRNLTCGRAGYALATVQLAQINQQVRVRIWLCAYYLH